ncbi:MAG: glycosyltransferase family 4 protein [Deltaproteobacteria bacterium]|nr:glycosyltransferase family 4 protein [Deltaproteobacteria bacterium]
MNLSGREHQEGIAMLGSLPPLRALSSYCLELSKAIADLSPVEFLSFKKIYPALLYPGGELKEDRTFPRLNHPHLRVRRRLTWYNPLTWIFEGVSARGVLLHAQWWSLPLSVIYIIICLGFRLRGRPVVFTAHNVLSHDRSALYGIFSRALFKLGDHFIVHSAANREQLISRYGISPERVTRIPHGPLDFHVKDDMERGTIRNEMGFSPDHRIVLLFGAVRPYKGTDTAIRAFAKVVAKVPTARLVIAGKLWQSWTEYEKLIESLALKDTVSTHLKYIPSDEVHRFFVAADVAILPYEHFDAQSGVGATAVSFRKPLIVTDVGGLPELVHDRRFVVPPGDPEALADVIIEAFENPGILKVMADGAAQIASKISWHRIAQNTWTVYEQVLSSKQRHANNR